MSKISELDIVKLSEFNESKLKALLSNSKKVRTILQFNEVAGNKNQATQKQVCDEIGVSVTTINRIRKELGVSSPYRYSVPTKTETQREKDKYRRIVNSSYKGGEISELEKSQLYTKINSNLDKGVKDEINKLITSKSEKSVGNSKSFKSSVRDKMKGGTYKATVDSDEDEPRKGTVINEINKTIESEIDTAKQARDILASMHSSNKNKL
jgi:DNA-binding XRE family transcriptional regulator